MGTATVDVIFCLDAIALALLGSGAYSVGAPRSGGALSYYRPTKTRNTANFGNGRFARSQKLYLAESEK